jgi:hypothetical protein
MFPERTYIGWLGRQDSNLGMAESKSKWFALFVNACSEKTRKYDLNPFKRLADISEYRDALGSRYVAPPGLLALPRRPIP